MHAYLLIGDRNGCLEHTLKLAAKLGAKILEFPLAKIADARELKNVTKLAFNAPTAIVINSIDQATEEALNAFLKNLEEPQENICFILTAEGISKVLPTIASRCQIIKIRTSKPTVLNKDAQKFLTLDVGERLKLASLIKDRGEAKEFVQNVAEIVHSNLANSAKNRLKTAQDLEILVKTLNNLNSNGNVGLQLANMVISLE